MKRHERKSGAKEPDLRRRVDFSSRLCTWRKCTAGYPGLFCLWNKALCEWLLHNVYEAKLKAVVGNCSYVAESGNHCERFRDNVQNIFSLFPSLSLVSKAKNSAMPHPMSSPGCRAQLLNLVLNYYRWPAARYTKKYKVSSGCSYAEII